MKRLSVALVLVCLAAGPAHSADTTKAFEADLAAKSAQVETLRARSALSPSPTTATTIIEADNLLRQLRAAAPDKRRALQAQLEAALARLELEIDTAARGKP